MIGMAKGLWRTPRCKEMDWQSFKQEDSTFYFVRNHFESIGKPILLKGGKVLLLNKMLIRAQVIATKNTHKLFHKSLSKPILKIGATNNFHRSHRFPPQTDPCQTLAHRCNRFHFGATEFGLPTFCYLDSQNRYHRD